MGLVVVRIEGVGREEIGGAGSAIGVDTVATGRGGGECGQRTARDGCSEEGGGARRPPHEIPQRLMLGSPPAPAPPAAPRSWVHRASSDPCNSLAVGNMRKTVILLHQADPSQPRPGRELPSLFDSLGPRPRLSDSERLEHP